MWSSPSLLPKRHESASAEDLDTTSGQLLQESWRTSQVFRPSTSALVELALRKAGLPGIGAKALSSISKTVIQKLVASLNET